MKKIENDKFLKEKLKEQNDEYEIKTTSASILARYQKEKEENKTSIPPVIIKEKKSFKSGTFLKYALPIASFSLILAISLSILIPQFSNTVNPEPPDDKPVDPDNPGLNDFGFDDLTTQDQEMITRQLNTIISFDSSTLSTALNNFNFVSPLSKDSLNITDRNHNYNNEALLNKVVDLYDPYSLGALNLINHHDYAITSTENLLTLSLGEEVLKVEYDMTYQQTRGEFIMEGNLITSTATYPITIKTEDEQNEKTIETIISYSENNVVKIEQENEINGSETENSLSYSTYTSLNEAYFDNFIQKFTYEYENEANEIEMEAEVETREGDELSLEYYSYNLSETSLYFEFEYEGYREDEFEGNVFFNLDNNNTRYYYFNNSDTPIIKN